MLVSMTLSIGSKEENICDTLCSTSGPQGTKGPKCQWFRVDTPSHAKQVKRPYWLEGSSGPLKMLYKPGHSPPSRRDTRANSRHPLHSCGAKATTSQPPSRCQDHLLLGMNSSFEPGMICCNLCMASPDRSRRLAPPSLENERWPAVFLGGHPFRTGKTETKRQTTPCAYILPFWFSHC